MDDYEMEESHMDRLSELPQSLILRILSFLPMRDVVATTILSKRWENLWTIVPCLNFSDIVSNYDDPDSHRFRNFVNRTLIFWKGTKLLKFIIGIETYFDKSLTGDINLWVRFAMENKVEELGIRLMYAPKVIVEDVYTAPQRLNSCSWIRELSLVGCNLRIPGSPSWDQLLRLRIDGFFFSEDLINRILLGTPRLEMFELSCIASNKNLNIWSTTLKKLKINKNFHHRNAQLSMDALLTINCPNLENFEISGAFFFKCLFSNISSLTDATLAYNDSRYVSISAHGIKVLGETIRHAFSTFQHVERVTLSYYPFKGLVASQKKNLFSPLPNAVFLKLEVFSSELVEMMHVLKIFPNLKTLFIRDCTFHHSTTINAHSYVEFETKLSKSFLLQLKIIKISSSLFDSSMLRCIEFLLKRGSMLDKLVIRVEGNMSRSKAHLLEVAETLLSMPRSSPTVKVIFNKK